MESIIESEYYAPKDIAIGVTFKSLRCNKGFSQRDAIAGNIISISTLSKFENGKTILSSHHFFAILENICTSMIEFQHAYQEQLYSNDMVLFNVELSEAYLERNTVKLKVMLHKLEQRIHPFKPLDSIPRKMRLDKIRIQILIHELDSTYPTALIDTSYLEKYFKSLKEWGQYDILLLGQCAKIFEPLTLYLLSREMRSPLQSLTKLHYVRHSMIQTLLNLITVFVEQKEFVFANQLIAYLEKEDVHEYYMYDKLTLIYNKATCAYQSGDKSVLETLEKCRKVLIFCDCFNTANWVDKEISDLKNSQ